MAMTKTQKTAFVQRMRKARGLPAAGTTEIVVSQPAAPARTARTVTFLAPPPPPPKPASRPKSLAARVGSAAVTAAVQEKELLASALTGFGIGYAEQNGYLEQLPDLDATLPIGKKGVLALTSYGIAKYIVKDPEIKKILMGVTSAAVTLASHEMGRGFAAKRNLEQALHPEGTKAAGEGNGAGI